MRLDNNIADTIRDVVEAFDAGDMEAIMGVYCKNGDIISRSSGFTWLERLGLGKMITTDALQDVYSKED